MKSFGGGGTRKVLRIANFSIHLVPRARIVLVILFFFLVIYPVVLHEKYAGQKEEKRGNLLLFPGNVT